jgi:hypothetical protein
MQNIKIYSLEDNKTGEVRYIGYTTKPLEERLKNHLKNVVEAFEIKSRKVNKRLSWLKSVNCDVSINLIDEGDISDVAWLESFYIELFISWNFKLTNGTKGGDGGNTWSKLSDEAKKLAGEKLSKALKGKSKVKTKEHEQKVLEKLIIYNNKIKSGVINHPSTGRKLNEKQKLAINKQGIASTVRGTSKYGLIGQYDINDNLVQQFNNPALAAEFFYPNTPTGECKIINNLRGNIVRAAKGKQKTCMGYIWKFL